MEAPKKAQRISKRFRGLLDGPSGSGKTYTALRIASGMGSKILVIDTEHSSASLYADDFDFDTIPLETFEPEKFIEAIAMGGKLGYDVIIVDSLSHAWEGEGGFLEQNEQTAKRKFQGNQWSAWSETTPVFRRLISTILGSPAHFIGTMRTKTEWLVEQNAKGKSAPKKVGLAPIFRAGSEYEFDLVGEITIDHELIVSKTRFKFLTDKLIKLPDEKLGEQIKNFLESGKAAEVTKPEVVTEYEPEPCPFDWKIEAEIRGFTGKAIALLTDEQILRACKSRKSLTQRDLVNLDAAQEWITNGRRVETLPNMVKAAGESRRAEEEKQEGE